jgi:hypothetical protein
LKPDVAALARTCRRYFGDGDLGCGRCEGAGLVGLFVTFCGRIGSGRLMVVSSGDDGIDSTEEFRLRIVVAEGTEDLLPMKELSRGRSGRFGVEGVVGV